MDSTLFFLERHAESIVVFFVSLAVIFVVLRPAMRFLIEYQQKCKVATIRKEVANRPVKLPDEEMEGLLQKASKMGMTDQDRLRRLAQSNPDRAKDLICAWIYGEGAGKSASTKEIRGKKI